MLDMILNRRIDPNSQDMAAESRKRRIIYYFNRLSAAMSV